MFKMFLFFFSYSLSSPWVLESQRIVGFLLLFVLSKNNTKHPPSSTSALSPSSAVAGEEPGAGAEAAHR